MTRSRRLWALAAVAAMTACVATENDPGGEAPRDAVAEDGGVQEAVWSADGRRMAATWLQAGGSRLMGIFGPVDGAPPSEGSGLPMADGAAGWATWAPDGLWVAYASGPEGSREIYRSRPDGMEPENLTNDGADDFDPAYSPDGRTLAFVSTRDGGVAKLHVMAADGGEPRLLADLGGPVRRPFWSPDGGRLVVQVTEDGQDVVYLVTADGTGVGRVATGSFPAWFPDGERVTYTEHDSIFWRPANGGSRRLLVPDARMGRPSPDGAWLAFVRGPAAGSALYLRNLEDGTDTRITPP